MFYFSRKKQPDFGIVSAEDDRDIEVYQIKKASRRGIWVESFKLLRDIALVLSIFFLLLVFVFQPVVVEGTSMLPQLHDGERLVVNKLIYYKIKSFDWGHIERGDIVCFWYPRDPDKSYVKRIIGLPGDTVEVRNGQVYINDKPMHEDYIDANYNKSGANYRREKVADHYYFVLGDNRDNSSDSRYWGQVPEKYIYGKVFFRYWRLGNFGFINHGSYELEEKADDKDMRADNPNEETDK